MASKICFLPSSTTLGHVAFVASAVMAVLTVALFFSLNLDKLPTALLAGGSGGLFLLSIVFYSCRCFNKPAPLQEEKPIQWKRETSGDSRIYNPDAIRNQSIFEDTRRKTSEMNGKLLETTQGYTSVLKIPSTGLGTTFTFSQMDPLDAALQFMEDEEDNYMPLVLNMADCLQVGGGVLNGSSRVEAGFCRRTNLYSGLFDFKQKTKDERETEAYISEEGGIYSQGVYIAKDAEGHDLPHYKEITVISIASYNLAASWPKDSDRGKFNLKTTGELDLEALTDILEKNEDYEQKIKIKIRNMFRKAYYKGQSHLILSDFGCTDFGNPPKLIARYIKEVLDEAEFEDVFEEILFAIPNQEHFEIFKEIFQGSSI